MLDEYPKESPKALKSNVETNSGVVVRPTLMGPNSFCDKLIDDVRAN